MVLLVDGHVVAADDLLGLPAVQASVSAFLAQPAALPAGVKTVYVCQGEIATCSSDEQAILATSDATTCCGLVIIESGGGGGGTLARVVHHDGSTALEPTVAGLDSQEARLWLAGGYLDEKGHGKRVTTRLLKFLELCPARLHVQLACLGALNTKPDGSPRAISLAVDLRSLQALPAAPDPPNRRGPLLPARSAQWAYRGSGDGNGSDGSDSGDDGSEGRGSKLLHVHNPATQQLDLSLQQGAPPADVRRYVGTLAALTDAQLLQRWSTSPLHEPSHFVADVRATFSWLLQQDGPVHSVTHHFSWSAAAGWQPAAGDNEAATAATAAAAPAAAAEAGGRAAREAAAGGRAAREAAADGSAAREAAAAVRT